MSGFHKYTIELSVMCSMAENMFFFKPMSKIPKSADRFSETDNCKWPYLFYFFGQNQHSWYQMTCSGAGFPEIHNLLYFQSKKEKPLSWLPYISIMIYYLWMKLYPYQIRLDNNLSRVKCDWPMDNFWTTKFIQWTIIYKMDYFMHVCSEQPVPGEGVIRYTDRVH